MATYREMDIKITLEVFSEQDQEDIKQIKIYLDDVEEVSAGTLMEAIRLFDKYVL